MPSTNTSPTESEGVQHFDQFSSQWWNPHGSLRTLHHINPIRLAFIQQQAQLDVSKEKIQARAIIDVGCGGGILTEALAPYAKKIIGIDLNASAIYTAKQHCQQQEGTAHISYQSISSEEMLAQKPKQFDIVTCMELLEHVDKPKTTIAQCADLCKPNGYVFFSTLNRHPKAFLLAIIGAEYLLNLIPKGTHHYAQFIKPSELDRFARQHYLSLQSIRGLHYNPLTSQAKLCDDLSVNYIACYQKNTC